MLAFIPGDAEEMEATFQIFADGFRGGDRRLHI